MVGGAVEPARRGAQNRGTGKNPTGESLTRGHGSNRRHPGQQRPVFNRDCGQLLRGQRLGNPRRARDDVAGASSGDLPCAALTQRLLPLRDERFSRRQKPLLRCSKSRAIQSVCWSGCLWFCGLSRLPLCDICLANLLCCLCVVLSSHRLVNSSGFFSRGKRNSVNVWRRNTLHRMKANGCTDCPIDRSSFSIGF